MFKKLLSTTILSAFSISIIFAQKAYQWKVANSAGYSYKYVTNDPMKARFYTLKNGLTIILSENHTQPRIQALIPTRAGSNTDPNTNTGLAHYLEHMLFKGTDKIGTNDFAKEKPLLDKIDALYEKYNKTKDTAARKAIYKEIDQTSNEASKYSIANEYDKLMSALGGSGSNAFTSFEQTVYTEEFPSNAIEKFLSLQSERFRNPILRIFHTELEAVYEEKNIGLDNDGRKTYETKYEALFPTHNYGQQTTIGLVEHLKNPSLVEIRNYYNKYYVPNNMAVILTGDFDSDKLIKKIEQAFGGMKPKAVQLYKPAPEAPLKGEIKREIFGPTPDNITIAWRWPGALNTNDRVIGTIVDEMMSNSKAGLIDLNLTKAQKVLRASSNPEWHKDYSVWQMTGTPKTSQSLDEVKALLMSELDKLKKGEFDESIIKAIAANYKLNAIGQLESNDGRAYGILQDFITSKGTNWHHSAALVDNLKNVTKKQVMDFANKYCGDGFVVVYKRKGEDKSIVKVEKPTITPVETNRDKESEYSKKFNAMPMASIKPVFLDFEKDLAKSKIANTELLSVKNTENDLFRLAYRFDMGSWNSKILPIALQYLNFLGTDKMTSEQISTEFYKLASNFSANATDHHISLGVSGLDENFEKTISLFEDLITNCKPNPEALELLKSNIMKQRNDAKLNKGAILSGLSSYAQFGPKNPRNSLILSNDELKGLKADDLVAFLHDLVKYKHIVTYFGPKSPEKLVADLPKLHAFPSQFKADLPEIASFQKITPEKTQVLFAEYDMVQAEINWIRPTVTFSAEQTPVIDLYNNYFGSGMSSIVFQTIRESKALAYSTYAYYMTPNLATEKYTMHGYVGTQADKLAESVVAMNELMNVFPAEQKNLDLAKDNMKKNMQTERITKDGIIYTYLSNKERGINYDERQLTYEKLDAFSLNDLKNFQDKNVANKPFTYCLVASEKKVDLEAMKKYGEVKKLSLEEIFGY